MVPENRPHGSGGGGGGLLLEGFAQLVEQPHVLDGDDGLAREARHQRDLLVPFSAPPVNRRSSG
jgi:hypothetical protein